RGQQAGLSQDAGDARMGTLTGRTAGAVGHRNKGGGQRRKPLDGFPQAAFHLLGLRREEFKGNGGRLQRAMPFWRGGRNLGHGATNSTYSVSMSWALVGPSGLATGHLKLS